MKKWVLGIALIVVAVFAIGLRTAPGVVEDGMNVVLPHEPYSISPEAKALHESLFVADLHADSLLWKRNLLERSRRGHIDLPRMVAGNVALQVFSATTKSPPGQNYEENSADADNITLLAMLQLWPVDTWSSLYARARFQLDKLIALAADSNGGLTVIRSREDLERLVRRRAAGEKVVGGVYLIEGAHPLEGDIDNLDRLYERGLRIAGLTHFFDNRVGGSLHGISGEGLTEFGREVIKRANDLGIIIDVAHASPKMVNDVLALSSSPVILSHGGMKGICDSARNLDDDLMQRIVEKGGLVGIGYWDGAVCDITPHGIVKSIRYAIERLGVEHVALGSDYDGTTSVLLDTSELAVLTDTMLAEGFTESEIRAVMGENVRRFLLEHLPGSALDEVGS